MATFTPGPWKRGHSAILATKTDDDGDPIVIAVPFGVNKTNNIRGLDCYSVPTQAEAQANATLMLAAPEMHEALYEALVLIEDEREVLEESFLPEPSKSEADLLTAYEQTTAKIKAAIAKAEAH